MTRADPWAHGAPEMRESVLPSFAEWRALLRAGAQDPMMRRYRAWVVLARVRLWALLWAGLVPLWIPLDLALVGGAAGRRLALGRIVVALALGGAAALCRCKPSQGNVWRAYAVLFGAPLVFFVALAPYFHPILQAASLQAASASAVYLATYRIFPLLIAASIGLLPVTAFEGFVLIGACLVASTVGVVISGFGTQALGPAQAVISPQAAELGWLWVLLVAGAVGSLAGLSQTALLLQHFRDAVTDPLTGLLNRRAGINLLALQWEQARREDRAFGAAMIDLDHFKRINDTFGHEAGDRVLAAFAARLRAGLRAGDALIRWGGEEFVAILPGAGAEEAAGRLEQVLREGAVTGPDGAALTFSAGVAERSRDGTPDPEALVALADRRLYAAKAAGRAAVVSAGAEQTADAAQAPGSAGTGRHG